MFMILKFAFRNVLKNRKRTILTASAVFTAAFIVAVAMGWMNGMIDMLLDNYKRYQTGDMRIITEGFIKREKFIPVDEIVENSSGLSGQIKIIPGVSSVEERIKFGIMLANSDKTFAAFGMGIDLKDSVLKLKDKIKEGSIEKSGIYIGTKLAAKLGVKLGENLLLATKTSEGGLNGIKLPVMGIFQYNMEMFDDQFFFIGLDDARKLLKIKKGTTELLVYAGNDRNVKNLIKKMLPEGLAVQDVRDQLGNLYDFMDTGKWIFYFIYALIVFLASFVVINTMMMAIFERTREIGTLKAMGMTDREIFLNFILEGGIIGAMGGILGGLLGFLFNFIFNKVGFNFDFAMQGIALPMEYIIRPQMGWDVLMITIFLSILVPALSTIYPARHAGKLMPAEALRKL